MSSLGLACVACYTHQTYKTSVSNWYKKARHVFIIQDIDFISSGYINHVKTPKRHQKFLGPRALIWAQGPK